MIIEEQTTDSNLTTANDNQVESNNNGNGSTNEGETGSDINNNVSQTQVQNDNLQTTNAPPTDSNNNDLSDIDSEQSNKRKNKLQRTDSIDIVTKTVPDGKFNLILINRFILFKNLILKILDLRKRSPVSKELHRPLPPVDEQSSIPADAHLQKLKNVSIKELKKDLEISAQQQRQKIRQNIDPILQASDGKTTVGAKQTKLAQQKKLQVEKLDITASLDVTSVGSSATPTPTDLAPNDQQSLAKQSRPKLSTKRAQGSVSGSGIKLTELEMAKLGRLGLPTAKGGPPVEGKKSPSLTPADKLSPAAKTSGAARSPKISPRQSPKPIAKKQLPLTDKTEQKLLAPAEPSETSGAVPATDVSGEEKKSTRLPRSEMPTRKQRMQQRKQQQAAASGRKTDEGTDADKKPMDDEVSKHSSSRSGSRERGPLSRDTSKDVSGGTKGSRKQSLMDQSPSSKAQKNINDYGYKLVALCRKGDWVGVDTIIKYINKYNVEFEKGAISETTGWSPLMFAVRDNRIQIVEQLIDLGIPINTKAKVNNDYDNLFFTLFAN